MSQQKKTEIFSKRLRERIARLALQQTEIASHLKVGLNNYGFVSSYTPVLIIFLRKVANQFPTVGNAFLVFAMALLAGCATPKMTTPSGVNEITVNAPTERVRTELINTLVNRGYEIRETSDLVIMGERDAGTAAAVFMGTMSNPYVKIRVRANLLAETNSVRVILRGCWVDGHYTENPLAPNPSTQAWLDQVKLRCEAK